MPVVLLTILSALGRIGVSMLMSLLTESVMKKLVLIALEKVAKRTESDLDDQLLQAVREAWSKPTEESK